MAPRRFRALLAVLLLLFSVPALPAGIPPVSKDRALPNLARNLLSRAADAIAGLLHGNGAGPINHAERLTVERIRVDPYWNGTPPAEGVPPWTPPTLFGIGDRWDKVWSDLADDIDRFRANGRFGVLAFAWYDDPLHKGYFGPAETHWGLVERTGRRKPAFDEFARLARRLLR
ncbi:MAG: hypothetical protein ABIK09_08870 [Pseudomonadota bacterium]